MSDLKRQRKEIFYPYFYDSNSSKRQNDRNIFTGFFFFKNYHEMFDLVFFWIQTCLFPSSSEKNKKNTSQCKCQCQFIEIRNRNHIRIRLLSLTKKELGGGGGQNACDIGSLKLIFPSLTATPHRGKGRWTDLGAYSYNCVLLAQLNAPAQQVFQLIILRCSISFQARNPGHYVS